MIKNIAYFPLQAAANSRSVMNAVLDSLQSWGIKCIENSMDADAAVIWSVLWAGRMKPNRVVYEHYRSQNKPVIVIDIGALYRGNTWKIAVNHITAQGYYGHKQNLDLDRPRKLMISLAKNSTSNPAVLVAAQHSASHQLTGVDQEDWISQQIHAVKQVTDRPIHVRSHPRSPLKWDKLPKNIVPVLPKHLTNTYDSFDIHFDYHAVINYNSGPGIQSAIAGAKPITHHSSLAAPVAVSVSDIDKPYELDRYQWLVEICHTEYILDEIVRGIWLKRIQSALQV